MSFYLILPIARDSRLTCAAANFPLFAFFAYIVCIHLFFSLSPLSLFPSISHSIEKAHFFRLRSAFFFFSLIAIYAGKWHPRSYGNIQIPPLICFFAISFFFFISGLPPKKRFMHQTCSFGARALFLCATFDIADRCKFWRRGSGTYCRASSSKARFAILSNAAQGGY